MLSKVLKGGDANKAEAMVFGTALAAPAAPRRPPGSSAPVSDADSGERASLRERVRQLEDSLAAAKRSAFEEGFRQGEEKTRAAVDPVLARLGASLAEIAGMRPELRRLAEKDAVELALRIARRVLHRELSVDTAALNALARVVFDRLARAESWQLTVHPRFADAIRGSLPSGSLRNVRIEADASVAPGTFVVESAEGTMDASIDTQLEEIDRGLTDRLVRK
jgi:flagellar assembly protein FliH